MGWWRCPGAFLISYGHNMQMLSPHRAWQSISWTCLPAHAPYCNPGAFSGCKLDHIILLLKTFKGLPFRMKANPLRRFTWLFLPGLGLSFLSHSVIQQILIVCLFYAQEKACGSARSRQRLHSQENCSHRGQISWVSGLVGGGQGRERRKDNLEPLIKQANITHFILTVVTIIVTVLPL